MICDKLTNGNTSQELFLVHVDEFRQFMCNFIPLSMSRSCDIAAKHSRSSHRSHQNG